MSKAHQRKKDPENVRAALVDCAAQIAGESGLRAISVQAVADAAGVTKGAFFHHFENKQALIDAVFGDLIARMDAYVDGHIGQHGSSFGCFTRAYIESVCAFEEDGRGSAWAALWLSAVTDVRLMAIWNTWLKKRLKKHAATDANERLLLSRMAADGLWLASLVEAKQKINGRLKERLLATTREDLG